MRDLAAAIGRLIMMLPTLDAEYAKIVSVAIADEIEARMSGDDEEGDEDDEEGDEDEEGDDEPATLVLDHAQS